MKRKESRLGPREALDSFYSMSGQLPEMISEQMFPDQLNLISQMVEDGDFDRERRAVARLMRDTCITLEQKEEIAQSILAGKYRITDPKPQLPDRARTPGAEARESERLKTTHLTMRRHQLQKPVFLEIKSETATIPEINPREHRSKLVTLLRQNSRINTTENRRLKATLHTAKIPQVSGRISDSLDSEAGAVIDTADDNRPMTKSDQMKLYLRDRTKKLEKDRVEVVLTREQALRQKELLQHSTERKVEIKKKLNEFRKKMKEYLTKQKHPMTGVIMRCVDESMVYHFMDKYDGFTMSVEAILALIGNSLGISLLYPDFPTEEDIEAAEAEQLYKHVVQNERAFRNSIKLDDPRKSSSGRLAGTFPGAGATAGSGSGDDNSNEHIVADPELDHYLSTHFDEHQLQGDGALSRSMGRIGTIRSGSGRGGSRMHSARAGSSGGVDVPLKLRRPRTEKKYRPHPLMPLISNPSTLHNSSPQRTASTGNIDSQFDSHAEVLSRSGKYAQSPKGLKDAVVGIPERKYAKDNRPPSPEKSFGGGYRASSAAEIRAKHENADNLSRRPVTIAGAATGALNPGSPIRSGRHQHMYLPSPSQLLNEHSQSHSHYSNIEDGDAAAAGSGIVFASEHVHAAGMELGLLQIDTTAAGRASTAGAVGGAVGVGGGPMFTDDLSATASPERTTTEQQPLSPAGRNLEEESGIDAVSLQSPDASEEGSVLVAGQMLAIAAMHEQLLEEDLLPSHQPERVLTADQLALLGTKKSSYEKIMRQVTNSRGGTTAGNAANRSSNEEGGSSDAAVGGGGIADDSSAIMDDSRPVTGQSDLQNHIDASLLEEITSGAYLSQSHTLLRAPSRGDHLGSSTQAHSSPHNRAEQQVTAGAEATSVAVTAAKELMRNQPPLHGTMLTALDRMRMERTAPQEIQAAEQRLLQGQDSLVSDMHASAAATAAAVASASAASAAGHQGVGQDEEMARITASVLRPLSPSLAAGSSDENINAAAAELPPLSAGVGDSSAVVGSVIGESNNSYGGIERIATLTGGGAPRGIKTREGERDMFGNPAPTSPFKSWHEKQAVLNSGVAAGAGLMLWRPRSRVTKHGRYRVGQGFRPQHPTPTTTAAAKQNIQRAPPKKPFVSAT